MKFRLFIFCVLLVLQGFAQGVHDGPYVRYIGDSILVQSVEKGRAVRDAFFALDKSGLEVLVNFPGHAGWDFWVKMHPKLKVEPSEFKQPEKLFFVSDIEGEFEGFRKLLIANKIMDENYNWTFGKGHVVVCGDLFDRGLQVTECLWLLYKLEGLAKKAGGYVHVILGNHDIMNLSGDLRYVQGKYLQSAKLMGVDYMSQYGVDSELGRWLRTKNVVEKIGDNLCLHAGMSPEVNRLGMSVKQMNALCRPYYDKAKSSRSIPDTLAATFFNGSTSPFWYRGYFTAPKATDGEVSETLQQYKIKRIVVGHTIVPSNISFYYKGKVLGIDIDRHTSDNRAVLFENGKWLIVDDKGIKAPLE